MYKYSLRSSVQRVLNYRSKCISEIWGGGFTQFASVSQSWFFFLETYLFLFQKIIKKKMKDNSYFFHSGDLVFYLFFKKCIYLFVSHLYSLWTNLTCGVGLFCLSGGFLFVVFALFSFYLPLPPPPSSGLATANVSLLVFFLLPYHLREITQCLSFSTYFT